MERKSDCIHEQVAKADCKCPLYKELSVLAEKYQLYEWKLYF